MSLLCKWSRPYSRFFFIFLKFVQLFFLLLSSTMGRIAGLFAFCPHEQPPASLFLSLSISSCSASLFSVSGLFRVRRNGGKVPKGFYLVVTGSFYGSALKEISHKVKQALWSSSSFLILQPSYGTGEICSNPTKNFGGLLFTRWSGRAAVVWVWHTIHPERICGTDPFINWGKWH